MKRVSAILVSLILALPAPGWAICRSYSANYTDGAFTYTYICESSFEAPRYIVVRNITESADVQVLEFAPREVGLICERYETQVSAHADCRQTRPLLGTTFQSQLGKFSIVPLDSDLGARFEAGAAFRHPESAGEAWMLGCAVERNERGDVTLWLGNDMHAMGECLIRLELDFANHPELLLRGQ
jgi:hypothetical protein